MAKQSLELRIELSCSSDSNLEIRKLDVLIAIANAIKDLQSKSKTYDNPSVTFKSSFASNLDLFKELPNNLDKINKHENQFNTKEN